MHPDAFDQWLAEVAPVDPREAAAEAAKINRDALATSAAALPLAERTSLIDQLLATNVAEIKAACRKPSLVTVDASAPQPIVVDLI